MQPKFCSIRDFAALSGIGRTKLYVLLGNGVLRTHKISPGQVLVDTEQGLNWIRSHGPAEVAPTAIRGSTRKIYA
jgi:hypothetical protein